METSKSLQNKLFHDSPEDALTTDVLACGGYKKVGNHTEGSSMTVLLAYLLICIGAAIGYAACAVMGANRDEG